MFLEMGLARSRKNLAYYEGGNSCGSPFCIKCLLCLVKRALELGWRALPDDVEAECINHLKPNSSSHVLELLVEQFRLDWIVEPVPGNSPGSSMEPSQAV